MDGKANSATGGTIFTPLLHKFHSLQLGVFLKYGYLLQIIDFKTIFHHKPSIWGYPHSWKPTFLILCASQAQISQSRKAGGIERMSIAARFVQRSCSIWVALSKQYQFQTDEGFRNQLKYLWRKPREVGGLTTSGIDGIVDLSLFEMHL